MASRMALGMVYTEGQTARRLPSMPFMGKRPTGSQGILLGSCRCALPANQTSPAGVDPGREVHRLTEGVVDSSMSPVAALPESSIPCSRAESTISMPARARP